MTTSFYVDCATADNEERRPADSEAKAERSWRNREIEAEK